MTEVKWIKITTDIFDDEKILLIESLPDAYAIITCWFKLLCLAGKMNNSGVFMMNNRVAYTDSMLATIFRMKETTVQLALRTFEKFGMVEIINGVITIPNWGKHQNIEGMERAKEQNRLRQKAWYDRQKELSNVSPNVSLTQPNATDIDKEKEKEKNKEIYKQVVSYLNEKAGTAYRASSSKTQTYIHARIADGFTLDDFKTVIDKKCAEWLGTDMEQYLRPETLFGTKFEGYLNAKIQKKSSKKFITAAEYKGAVNTDDIDALFEEI